MLRFAAVAVLLVALAVSVVFAQDTAAPPDPGTPARPRNVILFIGDGMGPVQISAASDYATGAPDRLGFQSFPVRSQISTANARSGVTDSAAAATAMATGVKVANGALSVRRPGSRAELPTIFELAERAGLSTGFVTTTSVTHATIAAFAAHEPRRHWYRRIAADYLEETRPNIIFGGAGAGVGQDAFRDAGYRVVANRAGLHGFGPMTAGEDRTIGHYAALLGDGHLPYLADGRPAAMPGLVVLTLAAVSILETDLDGYLLVVEAGRIDHAGHENDIARMIPEVLELDRTVEAVRSVQGVAASSLIVVTADHETGGLAVTQSYGQGVLPAVTWSTRGHTGVDVPLYAAGPGSEAFAGIRDNTEVFYLVREALGL